jgi:hypothetical protein
MSLSIQLPDNLEQQLSVYCQEHHLSINETVRLALERLLTTNPPLSPYQLGKDGFSRSQAPLGNAYPQAPLDVSSIPSRACS